MPYRRFNMKNVITEIIAITAQNHLAKVTN